MQVHERSFGMLCVSGLGWMSTVSLSCVSVLSVLYGVYREFIMSRRYCSVVVFFAAAVFVLAGSADAASAQKTFLWKVSSSHRVLYVTGVTQMLMPANYPLPKEVMRTFKKSGELLVEGNTDPGPREKKKVLSLVVKNGMLPSGKQLTDSLNSDQQKLVKGAFSNVGFPFARADSMRPWLAAIVMMQLGNKKMGIDPADQETRFFIKRAKLRKLPVTSLESDSYQIKMFSGIAQAQQVAWLTMVAGELSDMPSLRAMRSRMIAAWRDGDTKTVAKLLESRFRGHPKLYRALVTGRNRRWIKALVSRLSKNGTPVFVAVGVGHLAGPGNLVSALRKAGYKVTQL